MPENQFNEWSKPNFENPFPEIKEETPPKDENAIPATSSEATNEQGIEISNQDGPNATPPTPSYIDNQYSEQPHEKISMRPEIYRDPNNPLKIKPSEQNFGQRSKMRQDLDMSFNDWKNKDGQSFIEPPQENPAFIDPKETERRLDIDTHTETRKKALLKEVKNRARKLINAINNLLQAEGVDEETKKEFYRQFSNDDQSQMSGPAGA
ncbi:MAG: hypothetical protein PHW50_02730 [Patescibacteria group bacterium]|nr:hypothetical protein [Patescibacteria group bacterium]